MKILAHTCFIGETGFANHARSFFTELSKLHDIKIRNFTIGSTWSGYNNNPHDNEPYLTEGMKKLLHLQTLKQDNDLVDFPINNYDKNFIPDVNIVLMEMNHHYFYQNYTGYKIAYIVWETTRFPEDFFNRLFYFDEVWVPSQWQMDCLIEQGYKKEKIFVVNEGVDVNTFKPLENIEKKDKFRFLLFGRWDYRKSTTEIIRTFGETFKGNDEVELICSVENPFPFDGLTSTEERVKHHKLDYLNVKYIKFVPREDYAKYLQEGDVFLSCSRSEGWHLPLNESMACGTPSLYSNWSGQIEFAKDKGIPVNIIGLMPANIERKDFTGDYCEPDFEDLSKKMLDVYENYQHYKEKSLIESKDIRENFNWEKIAKHATEILLKKIDDFTFVTAGNLEYMPLIEQLVKSIESFSKRKIIVYGIDCDIPFDNASMIKKTISPPKHSEHDKWYWKQYACIDSIEQGYKNYVWIDGDSIANYNIDEVTKYFEKITIYPIADIHVQKDFVAFYDGKTQLFNYNLAKKHDVKRTAPLIHSCLYVYNKDCEWWFKDIIDFYKSTPLEEYKELLTWNDEGIDNYLRWLNGYTETLPVSNFDTTHSLERFYKFWNEKGPQNFNEVYGYQFIPKDKSNIIYFHGNKNITAAERMISFIKMKKNDNFLNSECFYTDVYKLEDFSDVKEIPGSTLEIAEKYGWARAIYHEIYNLREYYLNRQKGIFNGDIVVDLGANIGIFNRWAYAEGASKVISFEPDRRYFKLLSLNTNPKSILFNAAVSDKVGKMNLYESTHLGGSSLLKFNDFINSYEVRTYNLNYLFDTKLIDKIDFLKIDIEGSEISVFNGISDENLLKIRNIALEYHHGHLQYDKTLRENLIIRLNRLGFNSFVQFLGYDDNLQLIYFYR